jgi:hypothetical protein
VREPSQHSSSQYDRPNQPWVCGLSTEGEACSAGPTARGQCPALAECMPVRDADRWQCARSDVRGGSCTEGPTPEGGCGRVHQCHPLRSLRTIRGRFVRACTLVAAGALFILLNANSRDRAISPGPLAEQHAQLLENNVRDSNCAACHAAAERNVAGWAASLAIGHGDRSDQSQRCMECHDQTISKQFALAAHNLPADELRRLTTNPYTPNSVNDALACAKCHHEHQGAQFDLTAISDAACQSCHQRVYESFSTDHPDFGRWPYERRTRIAFNHASHSSKHFAEKKQAFDCRSCHVEDATRGEQLLVGYAAACASCHDEKISTSVAKGVPILMLPTLDVEALKEAGHDIGAWPEEATGDFDGRLPPTMKLLLASDPEAAKAMATLGADFEFFDVDPDDPQQLEATATLAGAIKQLFAELANAGPPAAAERLQISLRKEVTKSQLDVLFAAMPANLIASAAKSWLPNNGKAITPFSPVSEATPPKAIKPRTQRPIAFDPAGTWAQDDATLSIRYTPAAHVDPVLTGWLDLVAATPHLEQRPLALAMFKELTSATTPGLCASCHTAEQSKDGTFTVSWRAYDGAAQPRTFTKFAHGPHLLLPQLSDCTSCHTINDATNPATSTDQYDPHAFASDFQPLNKQQCAQCHTAKAAGESCQKCHNYHVDEIEVWRLQSISDFGLRISD